LGGVPADTTRLNFMMTDLNMPTFHHGGSTVAYTGDVVSRGAGNYTGPLPPHGESHNYSWTVEAPHAAAKIFGNGTAVEMCPPRRTMGATKETRYESIDAFVACVVAQMTVVPNP